MAFSAARLEALRHQLDYVAKRSPFYRQAMSALGIRPRRVRSFEEFHALPSVMDKARERVSLDASVAGEGHPFGLHLCCRPSELHSVLTTSGTTGRPTWYLFTKTDWRRSLRLVARAFRFMGIEPGDRVIYAMPSNGYIATIHVHALRMMGAVVFEAGSDRGASWIARLATLLRPRGVIATTSMLLAMMEATPREYGKVEKIVVAGEPGASIPAIRQKLEAHFSGTVYEIFGPVSGNMFASCGVDPYGGFHFLSPESGIWIEDLHHVDTGEPIALRDGAVGEGYITAIRHEAAPMLRYANGDVIRVQTARCNCGHAGPRMFILGRKEDFFAVGNRTMGIREVQAAAAQIGAIGQFRVVRPKNAGDRLTVAAELDASVADTRGVEAALGERLATPVEVLRLVPGSLPRSSAKTALLVDRGQLAEYLDRSI